MMSHRFQQAKEQINMFWGKPYVGERYFTGQLDKHGFLFLSG